MIGQPDRQTERTCCISWWRILSLSITREIHSFISPSIWSAGQTGKGSVVSYPQDTCRVHTVHAVNFSSVLTSQYMCRLSGVHRSYSFNTSFLFVHHLLHNSSPPPPPQPFLGAHFCGHYYHYCISTSILCSVGCGWFTLM